MLQDSNMYFNYTFLENLNLWVLLFYGRLPPQTAEMKRLCKITLDSSGWGCGIWIAKIFSTVNYNSWIFLCLDFLTGIFDTLCFGTPSCPLCIKGLLWCRRTNERKRSGEEIMEKGGLLHILSFGIQLAGSQSRLHNSSEWQTAQKFALLRCKKLYMQTDTWYDVKLYIMCK